MTDIPTRDVIAAATSIMQSDNEWLKTLALRDPDAFRDVAAALIARTHMLASAPTTAASGVNERLVEALRPFAKFAKTVDTTDDGLGPVEEDAAVEIYLGSRFCTLFSWATFRRAAEALSLADLSQANNAGGDGVFDQQGETFYSAKKLQELLDGRDQFIVAHGLWNKFCESLGRATPDTQGNG